MTYFPSGDRPVRDRPAPAPISDLALATEQILPLWRAFAPLRPERRRWALTKGRLEAARAGDALVAAGEVVVVVAGALATSVGASTLTAAILGAGDVAATGSDRSIRGGWIVDGQLYRTSREDWLETAGPEGLSYLLEAADRGRDGLERGLVCAASHLAVERVADLLTALHEATGLHAAPLSQDRLAQMLGLRRTTVNASCRALQARQLTRTVRGRIRLIDIGGLRRVSCGCRTAHPLRPTPSV